MAYAKVKIVKLCKYQGFRDTARMASTHTLEMFADVDDYPPHNRTILKQELRARNLGGAP